MTTYVGMVGLTSPLPEAAYAPVPVLNPLTVLVADGIAPLTRVGWNSSPIVGAFVVAILFPNNPAGGNPTTSYST